MADNRRGHHRRARTRYQPLVDYLAACRQSELALTFAQIEEILGTALNDGAHVNAYFWGRLTFLYVQRWRALGWRARLDRRNGSVIFTRDVGEGSR